MGNLLNIKGIWPSMGVTKAVPSKLTYLETHPWIKFEFNLEQAPPELWLQLGEIRSKCDHLSGVPLVPETAQRLHTVFLAKGVHATAAIGVQENERNLNNKISRGGFSAAFLLQCLRAVGVNSFSLAD